MTKQKRVVFDYIDSLLKDDEERTSEQMISEIIEIDLTDTEELAIELVEATLIEPEPEPEPASDLITDDEFESLLDQLQAAGEGAFAQPAVAKVAAVAEQETELSDAEIVAMMEASREADLAMSEPAPQPAPGVETEPPVETRPIIKAVLIDMHGMKLALPQDQMESVLDFAEVSMNISGLPEWIIGRVEGERGTFDIVDTAQWLIPEKYKPEYAEYQQFVVLPGRVWALACDGLVKSIEIPHDDLNWNTDRSQRGWLIGTYMPERCALIDVPYLVEAFTAKVE